MKTDYNIRTEAQADTAAIESLTVEAFREAAHSSHTEHLIVDALRKANRLSVSLVAEIEEGIVGHVAVSPVSISDGSDGWFGLGPISVLPEHQGKGIGSRLMEKSLLELENLGASGCVVLGDPGYYSRFGFRAEPELVLPGVPPKYFQALYFGPERAKGEVSYHEAFNAKG